jgi:hypothetical protein
MHYLETETPDVDAVVATCESIGQEFGAQRSSTKALYVRRALRHNHQRQGDRCLSLPS